MVVSRAQKKKSTKTGPYAYIMCMEGRENPEKYKATCFAAHTCPSSTRSCHSHPHPSRLHTCHRWQRRTCMHTRGALPLLHRLLPLVRGLLVVGILPPLEIISRARGHKQDHRVNIIIYNRNTVYIKTPAVMC